MTGKDEQEHLWEEEARRRVSAVMAECNDNKKYPTFASLLDALMLANYDMANRSLATTLNKSPDRYGATIGQYRKGVFNAPYHFVEALADRNLLLLDETQLQKQRGDSPAALCALRYLPKPG